MALYEADPAPSAFTKWAYRPTVDMLATVLVGVFRDARQTLGNGDHLTAGHLRWLLRLTGVRILWDKRWIDPGHRTDPDEMLTAAREYPTHVAALSDISQDDAELLASVVATRLGSIHLGAADGGILSQILQGHAITGDLQRAWKLYPTPRHLAWHMVSSLPFETIPAAQRVVWDGTCGTGTILVAALERLRALAPALSLPELRRYLTQQLTGNDQAVAMTDASRIALDLALGAAAGTEWKISTGDVRQTTFTDGRPNIILGNPPFHGHGWTLNTAVQLLETYADALPAGGLISVIEPASIGSSESARAMRRKLVKQFDWYEVTELPPRTIQGINQEALVLSGRRRISAASDASVVTWRRMNRDGKTLNVEALQQRHWLDDKRDPLVPPLAVRLRHHLRRFPSLADFVPDTNLTVGITPGVEGQADVLSAPESDASRYLTGQFSVDPFVVQWERTPRWLRYDSPRLQWPRRPKEQIFQSPKVLLTRHGAGSGPWRTQAAVDEHGLYPSDTFVAVIPAHSLSLDFLTGVFNSTLFNCWLDLINATGTMTLPQLRQWPVPDDTLAIDRIARLAAKLRQERSSSAVAAGEQLLHLTLKVDDAVLDAYVIPTDLRAQVAEHMLAYQANRPGFDGVAVARPPLSNEQGAFTPEHAVRLQQLFDTREDRDLTSSELEELERLVAEWQHSVAAAASKYIPAPSERAAAGVV